MASLQVWGQISVAAEKVEKNLQADSRFKGPGELLKASPHQPSLSGLQDIDYPNLKFRIPIISNISKVALPTEVIEQYMNMRQNCVLGVFPEISRAWLAVDSCIFFWAYDNAGDVGYYDGLDQTIISVHLVKPKPNIFKSHIKYILCLITASEITLLGVTCPEDPNQSDIPTFLLISDPLFKLSTDNVILSVVAGTDDGRIFAAGNDGCLYEIFYQAEDGWFSRKCRKINHSHSLLSYVTPSFLSFNEHEPIVQIEIDNSRNLLYAITDKSSIQLYDFGTTSGNLRQVSSKSLSAVVYQASCIARTIDTSNFKPIVGIKALAKDESEDVHLVAVTQAGVRLFFSVSGGERPSSLELVHVRLPPGFTPASAVQRPNSVSNIYYRDNACIMTSLQAENKDFLWILSNDYYVYEDQMMEAFGVSSLEGRVWCIAEEIRKTPSRTGYETKNPPLIVKQHFEERRKFVLLTSEGVFIFYKQRPIDQLSLILTETQNPESPIVRTFFHSTKLTEACLTSLILASTSNMPQELPLREWSTLAFFLYGSSAVDSQFSSRHDAIYLYLARILRPIWLLKAAEEIEVTPYLKRLVELKKFIHSNSHIDGDQTKYPNKISLKSPLERGTKSWAPPIHLDSRYQVDVESESESLNALNYLLTRCIEVLNLYKLLFDHGFGVNLPQEPQLKLSVMTFRDLIVMGGDMTTNIASALVRRYIDDNITTDAICRQLNELCPSIFRQENALQAKAHEMVLQSRTIVDKVDKDKMMNEACSLLKKIGVRLDLQAVCDLLHSARAYKYIVDICLFVAEKRDPTNLAGFQQASRITGKTLDDTEERTRATAINLRIDCYMKIFDTLDRLMNHEEFDEVFQACIKSADELFHTKLYEWLCEKNLSSKLLEVRSPYVESFLRKKAESDCYSTSHLDLMWRFYERRGNFLGAAQVLDQLASKPSADYELEERLAYLSRAKGCVEAMATPGEYLHELEEKMEVVRIQIQLFKKLKELPKTPTISDALSQLNYSLMDLTQLYQNYAQKFNLFDCQLAILKCGNHYDPTLIERLWKNIIDEILHNSQEETEETQLHILSSRIENLGKTLMPSERFFPVYFIIAYLEFRTHTYHNFRWVPHCLMEIGFKPLNLLEPYHKFYKSREHSVYWPGKQIHVLRVIATLVEDSLDKSDRLFATACLDVLCDYLIELQAMAADSNVRKLQDTFTFLQSKINARLAAAAHC